MTTLIVLALVQKSAMEPFRLSARPVIENGVWSAIRAKLTNLTNKPQWVFEMNLTTVEYVKNDRPENWEEVFVCGTAIDRKPVLRKVLPGQSLSCDINLSSNLKPGKYEVGVRYSETYARSLDLPLTKTIRTAIRKDLLSNTIPVQVSRAGVYVVPGTPEPDDSITITVRPNP